MSHLLVEALGLLTCAKAIDAELDAILSKRLGALEAPQKKASVNGGVCTSPRRPSQAVQRAESLLRGAEANGAKLSVLLGGAVTVAQPAIPTREGAASVDDAVALSLPSPQQLVDAARPGDVVVLRPGVYVDAPLRITVPYITVRCGGRAVPPANVRGAHAYSSEHYHTIAFGSGEELVPKTAVVLSNGTDKAAVSIHAVGVCLEGLYLFQTSSLAPAVHVHVPSSDATQQHPCVSEEALRATESVVGAYERPKVGDASVSAAQQSQQSLVDALGAVRIRGCKIASANCHAVHATSTGAAVLTSSSTVTSVTVGTAAAAAASSPFPTSTRRGLLEIVDSHIRSTLGSGVQIGHTRPHAADAAAADATHGGWDASAAMPPRVRGLLLRGVTFGRCGASGVVVSDPRCEWARIEGCSFNEGVGEYGIHLVTVPAAPSPQQQQNANAEGRRASSGADASSSFAARNSSLLRASSATLGGRRPPPSRAVASASLIRRAAAAAATSSSVVDVSLLLSHQTPQPQLGGDAHLLRQRQHRYAFTILDTFIKSPQVCGIVVEGGRVVSRISRTTAILTEPNSVGLFVHPEGYLLESDNNSL